MANIDDFNSSVLFFHFSFQPKEIVFMVSSDCEVQ